MTGGSPDNEAVRLFCGTLDKHLARSGSEVCCEVFADFHLANSMKLTCAEVSARYPRETRKGCHSAVGSQEGPAGTGGPCSRKLSVAAVDNQFPVPWKGYSLVGG